MFGLCLRSSHENLTLESILQAKQDYEKTLSRAGHTVKYYRADNGGFSDNGFIDTCNSKDQTISYCGIGAYYRKGIVEHKNRILTQGARTLLLHGIRMWPQMIDQMFWPFAIKGMAERLNSLHLNTNGQTPESILYNIPIEEIPVKTFYTLFCPVYMLDHRSQHDGGPGSPK